MLGEVDELLRVALEDDTFGVNAKLDVLPLPAGLEVPPVKRIVSALSDVNVADGVVGDDWPVVVIGLQRPAVVKSDVSQQQRRRATMVPMSFAYCTRHEDKQQAHLHGVYTLRAILLTIWALQRQDVNGAYRLLRDVALGPLENDVLYGPVGLETADGARLTASIVVTWGVTDNLQP